MMNKHIRMMIDELFSQMKMTAENLALRDELLANAQDRYEDAIAQGKTEDDAFVEVAASLGDVHALLEEMNAEPVQEQSDAAQEPEADEPQREALKAEGAQADAKQTTGTDLGDALNKAFTALGDLGQTLMPQAKKFVRQMDNATGGMIRDLGKAAQKGFADAQKAAGEAIDRLSGEKGELVFDFGAKKQERPTEDAKTADALRKEAADLRAQAGIKSVTGDLETAGQMNAQADVLETQADAIEQSQAMEAARKAVQEMHEAPQNKEPLTDENGDVNEDALSRAVEEAVREAENAARQTAEAVKDTVNHVMHDAEYIVRDANEPVSGSRTFPAAGLHKIDIKLDADDVCIEAAAGGDIETLWEACNVDGEPALSMDGHTLTIRRKNPDVFKTFFSVVKKDGGKITVRVPRGYAASYEVNTTSGDILLRGIDADDVKATTTSGCVRIEPDATVRAEGIRVTTVSGHATVSACANDIVVTTVSGNQFVSCDAHKVDVNVVSGKVHVEGACDEWEIDAVSSDVELLCTVAPTKKVQISSLYGTARLALPEDIRGFVAETNAALGCEIVNEFGPNRYGTCALPIRMDTLHGQLMITRL